MGGVFVKKWTFPPQNKTKPIFCILHLLIRGLRTHQPHPPCLGAWVSCRGWRMKMATVLNVSHPTNALCNKTRLQILTDGPPYWLIDWIADYKCLPVGWSWWYCTERDSDIILFHICRLIFAAIGEMFVTVIALKCTLLVSQWCMWT